MKNLKRITALVLLLILLFSATLFSQAKIEYIFTATVPGQTPAKKKVNDGKRTSGSESGDGKIREKLSESESRGLEGPGLQVDVPVYIQGEYADRLSPWHTIATGGCGQTVSAMICSAFTGDAITPPDIANEFSYEKYPNIYGEFGTTTELYDLIAQKYGFTANTESSFDREKVISHLRNGGLVVITDNGATYGVNHFLLIKGVTEDGQNFYIHDPASREKSNQLWSVDSVSSYAGYTTYWSK